MKRSKQSFAVVSLLFAVLLSLSIGTLNARDADLASRTFAAAQTAKQDRHDRQRSPSPSLQALLTRTDE